MSEGSLSGVRDPLIGTLIAGRYRIVDRLASGGMGTVYKAEQLGLDRMVAVKILDPSQLEGTTQDSRAEDDAAVLEKRFSREAAMLAKLAHPNIVTVFDYGSIESSGPTSAYTRRFYMAMELLDGETLQTRLTNKRRLHADEAVNLGAQVARALREAHAHGIVHRDLKPANVMIVTGRDGEDVIKLLDFGIGKIINASLSTDDPRAELTQEGRFVGSPLYMSPEQIAHGNVDARTDVYSLGVLLYRTIAGVHPFQKDNTALVMLAHLSQEAAPLRERVRDVPIWLDEIVQRCLIKDPNNRLGSMDELLRALGDHVPSLSIPSSRHSPMPVRVLSEPPPTIEGLRGTLAEGAFTPHTHHATTVSAPPQAAPVSLPPKRRSAAIFVLPGLVLVALLVAVVIRVTRSDATPPVAPSTSSTPATSTFKVTFTTNPPGARVIENGKVLSQTPFTYNVDSASVREQARVFSLELEGYQSVKIFQGASEAPVSHAYDLVAITGPLLNGVDAAPSSAPTAVGTGKKIVPTAKPSVSASAPKPPDINLVR